MRIVHEFEGDKKFPQGGGTGNFYGLKVTEVPPSKFPGFQADIMVSMTSRIGEEGEVLYLEGDGVAMRAALMSLVRTLDFVEIKAKEDWESHRASLSFCARCETWRTKIHHCLKLSPPDAPFKGEKIVFTDSDGQNYYGTLETMPDVRHSLDPQSCPHSPHDCDHHEWVAHVCVDVGTYAKKSIPDWTKVRRT